MWERVNYHLPAAAQAELQSSRQKVTLYESMPPLARLGPGERHDFLIRHDIREISAYTLICSTSYSLNNETAYQPQYFKFVAQNPLLVRTKIRTLPKQTLLEACVENNTNKCLVLASLRFETAPNIMAVPINQVPEETAAEADGDGLSAYAARLQVWHLRVLLTALIPSLHCC
jgi:hypothetical protein